ncbi:MAG TPA: Omp28-related outer membrane protein [Bacteroidia bacterium]
MKNQLILFISILSCSYAQSQNYYHIRRDGQLPTGYYLDKIYDSKKHILLNEPSASFLSGVDSLPFDFKFYGQPVKYYKASDNGYLTFDTIQTISELPIGNRPFNSILAFWDDFKLQKLPTPNEGVGIQVFSYTDGVAPNRRHIVQFFGLSLFTDPLNGTVSNSSIYAFAIVFHEGPSGTFDLVYTPYGDKTRKAFIGCINQDGSLQKKLNDSLSNLPFQFSFDKNNFIVYRFQYGSQALYDLECSKLNLNDVYPVNAIVNISGEVVNVGTKDINNFTINYSVNGSDTISFDVIGANLKHNGESKYTFNHPISWTSGSLGSLNNVNVWLSNLDGNEDLIQANSNIKKVILRNGNNYIADRNILLEEGTGAWCGYCPEGHLLMAEAIKQHGKRIVAVSYHFDDSMSNDQGNEFLSHYFTSYPDAMLDRKVFLGSTNTWLNEINARLNGKSPVELDVDLKTFNPLTREITYRVKATFSDYWYGNLSLGSIVTEDKVRGNDNPNVWSQNNYYSKFHNGGAGGSSHPLYEEEEFLRGYLHQHVMKAMPGGLWGVDSLIPTFITPNSVFTKEFTYTLPEIETVFYNKDYFSLYCNTIDSEGQNEGRNVPANINLIGFVAVNDSVLNNRTILNSSEERLWNLTNIENISIINGIAVYPNPSNSILNIQLNVNTIENLSFSIFDVNGKMLSNESVEIENIGTFIHTISVQDLVNGIYTIKVSNGQQISYLKFQVIH